MSSKMIPPPWPAQEACRPPAPDFGAAAAGDGGAFGPAQCQDGAEWDRARAALKASAPGSIAPAVARWRQLVGTENQGFGTYAGFVLAWPGFPQEEQLRKAAEKSLAREAVDAAQIVALFDRLPPLTNPARARYALAGRPWPQHGCRRLGARRLARRHHERCRRGRDRRALGQTSRRRTTTPGWKRCCGMARRAGAADAGTRLCQPDRAGAGAPRHPAGANQRSAPARTRTRSAGRGPPFVRPAPTPETTPAPALVVTPDMLRDPGYLVDARAACRAGNRGRRAAGQPPHAGAPRA
jgi:soluble lytic murein transglycosylase